MRNCIFIHYVLVANMRTIQKLLKKGWHDLEDQFSKTFSLPERLEMVVVITFPAFVDLLQFLILKVRSRGTRRQFIFLSRD